MEPTHNLKELADLMWVKYSIEEPYMGEIPDFCNCYSKMLEGDNVEYFRYPEYSRKRYFAGNRLDIEWLSYNFALIYHRNHKVIFDYLFKSSYMPV